MNPTTPLKRARLAQGITQLHLAIRAGCSVNTVSMSERGAPLSRDMAERFAKALSVDVSVLVEVKP